MYRATVSSWAVCCLVWFNSARRVVAGLQVCCSNIQLLRLLSAVCFVFIVMLLLLQRKLSPATVMLWLKLLVTVCWGMFLATGRGEAEVGDSTSSHTCTGDLRECSVAGPFLTQCLQRNVAGVWARMPDERGPLYRCQGSSSTLPVPSPSPKYG
jgi:hypothetical protein